MFKAASAFYNKDGTVLTNEGMIWTFIDPNTPHYGGLWEVDFISVKFLLITLFEKPV
jgi:hypothetical protein